MKYNAVIKKNEVDLYILIQNELQDTLIKLQHMHDSNCFFYNTDKTTYFKLSYIFIFLYTIYRKRPENIHKYTVYLYIMYK